MPEKVKEACEDDLFRCDVDGSLVTAKTFGDHLGHHVRQPVSLSLKEKLLWNLGLLR